MTAKPSNRSEMRTAELAASMAIAAAVRYQGPLPPRPFVQRFEECEKHGKYPTNMQDAQGRERWHMAGCPTCRKQARTSALLAGSGIPRRFADCTFDNYSATTSKQQQVLRHCREYADGFAQRHQVGVCLLLCGNPGTGKNHLATAISRVVKEAGFSVLRIKAAEYLESFWAKQFDERQRFIKGLADVDLLYLDEIGRSSDAKAAKDALFRLIDARYEEQRPTLITSNLGRDELIATLGDAAYDRLAQGGGQRLSLDWESFRSVLPRRGHHEDQA